MNSQPSPTNGLRTPVTYKTVTVSEKGLAEVHDGRRVVFVPRESVKTIELRFGPRAENPVLQVAFGSALIVLGMAGCLWLCGAGLVFFRWWGGFLLLAGLGLWLLWEGLTRRHYLKVISNHDERKLVFSGKVQRAELMDFLNAASQLGYTFKNCLADESSSSKPDAKL